MGLLSPLRRLTSVFGMVTGVTAAPLPPDSFSPAPWQPDIAAHDLPAFRENLRLTQLTLTRTNPGFSEIKSPGY